MFLTRPPLARAWPDGVSSGYDGAAGLPGSWIAVFSIPPCISLVGGGSCRVVAESVRGGLRWWSSMPDANEREEKDSEDGESDGGKGGYAFVQAENPTAAPGLADARVCIRRGFPQP